MMASLLFFLFFQGPAERVIGLLDFPEVLGSGPCVPYTEKVVNVFTGPSTSLERIATIEVITPMHLEPNGGCTPPAVGVKWLNGRIGELPTEEIGYEIPAAIAYERSGNWFRIRLDEGSGWIQIDDPEKFSSYANLVTSDERAPYLDEAWDGRLFNEPDRSSLTMALPAQWRNLIGKPISYVKVVESQTRGGELWFRIRLGAENACAELLDNAPVVEGWIPAYVGEKRIVWFYSRGC
jgi:hypothetical protein